MGEDKVDTLRSWAAEQNGPNLYVSRDAFLTLCDMAARTARADGVGDVAAGVAQCRKDPSPNALIAADTITALAAELSQRSKDFKMAGGVMEATIKELRAKLSEAEVARVKADTARKAAEQRAEQTVAQNMFRLNAMRGALEAGATSLGSIWSQPDNEAWRARLKDIGDRLRAAALSASEAEGKPTPLDPETVEACAKVAANDAAMSSHNLWKARQAGRNAVASYRESDIATANRIKHAIRSLTGGPNAK